MNLRETVRKILQESNSPIENVESVRSTITSYDATPFGYTVLDVVKETSNFVDALVFTVTLQHTKPDFKKYVNQMAARGGKFATIYGDTPTAKTMITRWLTGFKEGADIDARQKSAAIKVAQVAGLDALAPLLQSLESTYNCTCVANFTGAKTKNKGLSFFELYVFDISQEISSPLPEAPKPPTEIPVDDEVIEIPPEPAKPLKKQKIRKKRVKQPKLTRDQKKAGYNQIDRDGRVRHVTSLGDLEDISDHIVDLVLGYGPTKVRQLPDPMHHYTNLKNRTYNETHPFRVFRVIDDYYEDDAPILKIHKAYVIEGGQIRSRSMMQQYTSLGSNRKYIDKQAHKADPNFGRSFADRDFGDYTPPKLGSKEAKDARRYAQKERVNDEIIMYASIHPKKNKFTGHRSIHTGKVVLYLFLLDRNLE